MPEIIPDWETVKSFVEAFGWTKGVFTIFFFLAHYWVYTLYNKLLKQKQDEIERLAADNREYRQRFLQFHDDRIGYKPKVTEKKHVSKSERKGGR